jgi:predicted dehydrogenase
VIEFANQNLTQFKMAVIGCGSIGRRHIRNLCALQVREIYGYDKDPKRLDKTIFEYDIKGQSSVSELLSVRPDGVIICTPTNLHLPLALEAAKAGCHLFIEKPLADCLEGMEDLLKEVNQRNLITFIGCNFKFHPSFVKMKEILESGTIGRVLSARCQFGQYLPDWHPWEDYRETYSSRMDLGGGVLLDSHEFDYLSWFLGGVEKVFCLSGKLSDLEIETEDTAEVLLRFDGGAIGEIHLDYTQRAYQRNYEFFGEKGTLKWDFNERQVCLYKAEEKIWEIFIEPRDYDLNTMYIEEMKHFLDCVQNSKPSVTDIHSGLKTLMTILAAKTSVREGRIKELNRHAPPGAWHHES